MQTPADIFKRRLLIVDDEKEIRESLAEFFSLRGVECVKAATGEEALHHLANQAFTAILCDIFMPGMDGLQLLAEQRKSMSEIPFVILTGYQSRDLVLTALRLGALDFVDKPFEFDELERVVYRALEIGVRRFRLRASGTVTKPLSESEKEHELRMIHLLQIVNHLQRRKRKNIA